MHTLRDSFQWGILRQKVSFILDLSNTEKCGLFTLLGNSSEWHGCISHTFPNKFDTSSAKSYQDATPSFEKW